VLLWILAGIAILLGLEAELGAALFAFQMLAGALVMSQGAGAYALAAFPGTLFLRWDLAAAAFVAAFLLAAFSKPTFKRPEQAGTPGSSGHQPQTPSEAS
jgi:hypothetical protein